MTEQQARDAKRLVEKLDNIKRLPDKISAQYRKAIEGDKDAIEKLTNVAHELAQELIGYIERDIRAL
jgi:hypothetical protein